MLYENEDDIVFLCGNCDAEFMVTKLDDDDAGVVFCPYCGDTVVDLDEDDDIDDE